MASFFDRFTGRKEPRSAEIAKERLKLVLVSDRSQLSPEKLGAMQAEIIEVIKRYIPINELEVEIKLEQRDRKNYLVADIPLHPDHSYRKAESEAADTSETNAKPDDPDAKPDAES